MTKTKTEALAIAAPELFDQVARWHGNRWDLARLCPDGNVPKDVMRQVVGELLRREVVG